MRKEEFIALGISEELAAKAAEESKKELASYEFDGGLLMSISTPGQTATESATGPIQQQIEKVATELLVTKEVISKTIRADQILTEDITAVTGNFTKYLTGVRIIGDIIEANTIAADKLLIRGDDGLYYALNVDALGKVAASKDEKYKKGIDGSVIVAESITADKLHVTDLDSVSAKIAGIDLEKGTMHSAGKSSVDSTATGFYLDKEGQICFGDESSYIKWAKNDAGEFHLTITGESVTFGSGSLSSKLEGINSTASSAYNVASTANSTANSAHSVASTANNTANSAYSAATKYMKFYPKLGLIVGEFDTDQNPSGGNTLIDKNGMAVRNDNMELVRFGTGNLNINDTSVVTNYNGSCTIINSQDNIFINTEQTYQQKHVRAELSLYYDETHDNPGFVIGTRECAVGSVDIWEAPLKGISFSKYGGYMYHDSLSLLTKKSTIDVFSDTDLNHDSSGIALFTLGSICANSNDVYAYLGQNNVLWSGTHHMAGGSSITLDSPISKQMSGIVLVWSRYGYHETYGWIGYNDNWSFFFIPKYFIKMPINSRGVVMNDEYIGMRKYVYISDSSITGHDVNFQSGTKNGIAFDSTNFVLRYVIGV